METPFCEKPLRDERIVLWPPQDAAAKLIPAGRRRALVNWQPPLVNAEAVGGYEIERTTYWPGIVPERKVIGCVAGGALEFEDSAVKSDEVNEYRVRAFHSDLNAIKGPWSYPAAIFGFAYTTYDTLLTELRRFALEHPEVCRIIDAGPADRSRTGFGVRYSGAINGNRPTALASCWRAMSTRES